MHFDLSNVIITQWFSSHIRMRVLHKRVRLQQTTLSACCQLTLESVSLTKDTRCCRGPFGGKRLHKRCKFSPADGNVIFHEMTFLAHFPPQKCSMFSPILNTMSFIILQSHHHWYAGTDLCYKDQLLPTNTRTQNHGFHKYQKKTKQ